MDTIFNPHIAFIAIIQLISDYQKNNSPLKQHEHGFLLALDNRVRAIISIYRGWQKYDVIAEALQSGKPLSQEIINQTYLETKLKTTRFICITIGQLLHDARVEKNKYSASVSDYYVLLANIEESIETVLNHINEYMVQTNNKSVTDIVDSIDFTRFNAIFKSFMDYCLNLLPLLHGRYLPFFQSFDPFISVEKKSGRVTGNCYGHVKSWCNAVQQFGYCAKAHCLDEEAYEAQMHQIGIFHYAQWIGDYYAATDFRVLLTDMLAHVRPDKVYQLLFSIGDHNYHVAGIRYIPLCGSIEYFDPNIGTLVFEQREEFASFMANYFCRCDFDLFVLNTIVQGSMQLYMAGNQPANAIPSIPSFATRKYNLRNSAALLREMSFTLAEVAARRNMWITDKSYIARHNDAMFGSGIVGACVGFVASYPIVSQVAGVYCFTAVCTVSSILFECKTKAITWTMTNALFGLYKKILQSYPDDLTHDPAAEVSKKHTRVKTSKAKRYSAANNAFLFHTRKYATRSHSATVISESVSNKRQEVSEAQAGERAPKKLR